ncbi:uncharacterized protein LAJ45_05016 [Morchella importuna]|uniref:Auxin efflux carrier n=1 Tax=Morchella conica CCBAS932 TaxID=1392247 RepID=A0A3N4KXL8_9PEZI|nr:uncharacterized protein LAJ45_05016 [Morchella importuna]KAH8150835.1 hypothetical protein LAJ45_05016 [Morchella importuna]RPB14159.1 hypothetical protein P167DRAFT_534391 [Morchella conica CCBAS932]
MPGNSIGIGKVIFVAIKPMVKMAAIAGGGVYFAKKGFLTPEVCKANASILMNLLLPLLIFATVLPAFDRDNMTSVLSVVVTGGLYQVMGLVFGLIVRWLTPVPPSWRGGVLAAGIFSNLGDLVIAYLSTLAKSEPFHGEEDVTKGIAYSSIFMVVQTIAIFNLGGLQLIRSDFNISRDSLAEANLEKVETPISPAPPSSDAPFSLRKSLTILAHAFRRTSPSSPTPAPTISDEKTSPAPPTIPTRRRIWLALLPFLTAPSIALLVSLVAANIPEFKALFVKTPGVNMPEAPDQNPPLDFIMDLATFAQPTVPVLGLILLGANLSRLSMKGLPKGFWKSAVLMAVLKLIVGPIIGIAWTTGLTRQTSWISTEDKMLQLVLIIGSAVPTATAQVYLTNIFAPLGPEGCVELSALSATLLAQYALMLLTLTATVAYSLVFVL